MVKPPHQIGQQILHGKGNRQGQDTGHCNHTGDIDAQGGSHIDAQQQVQRHLQNPQHHAVSGLFQPGSAQSAPHQLH